MAVSVESWHRRHALQIVAALPETVEDALIVLRLATLLVTGFLAEGETRQVPLDLNLERERGNVVSLSSATSGNSR